MIFDRGRILVAAVLLSLGTVAPAAEPATAITLAPDLQVRELQPGVWLHVSRKDDIPANGLVVKTAKGLLLVDTPWTDAQTDVLVPWAEKTIGARFVKAVATHWHADRTGGAAALQRRQIPLTVLDLTATKLRETRPGTEPSVLFTAKAASHVDPLGFEVFHPGHGHTFDNVVVWLPAQRILFGGCFLKAEDETQMGYIKEADLTSWPLAVDAVRTRFATATTVIPGHGAVGTLAALDRTTTLIREHVAKTK